jgi:transposase
VAVIPGLLKRIEELEALVKQNSSNSSRPPSSDPPSAPDKPTAPSSGRKRGGQPGHVKHERELVPEAEVTRVVEVVPEACEVCHEPLRGVDPEPKRHQVFELPEIRAEVDEFRLHRLGCNNCGHQTRASLPDGVPRGQFGPRLIAFLAACTGYYYLSRRQTQEVASGLVGVRLSLGAVSDAEQTVSAAVAAPTAEAAEHIKEQRSAHADETGWRIGKAKAWLWTAVTRSVAVFVVAGSRGSDVAKQLLGEAFAGFLHSDRWCGYAWVSVVRRQLCWAHLLRHFVMFQDYSGEARRIGQELEDLTRWMFTFWHKIRDGTMDRATFVAIMQRMRPNLLNLLEQGRGVPVRKVASMCREILALEQALFTFVDVEGLEPTNNRAERAIRPAVLWRKRSFGNDSEAGARFTERMLTVTTTLRLQNRNVLQFLTQCCQAALLKRKPPSLLPATAD